MLHSVPGAIDVNTTELKITGQTTEGQKFFGTDAV